MVWKPTGAGPRNRREHFYHWFRQLTQLGELVGELPDVEPPATPPPQRPTAHNHWLQNLTDVDPTGLARNQGLFYNPDTGFFEVGTRLNFVRPYTPGNTYYKDDAVLDEGWLMAANQETTEAAAPSRLGSPFYAYSGIMDEQALLASQIVFGNRYTVASTGYIDGYRVYTVTGNDYVVYVVEDPLGTPVLRTLANFTATVTGWVNFAVPPTFITTGLVIDLIAVVREPDPTPTIQTFNYNYQTPQNTTVPVAGQIQHARGQADIINIHYTDNDTTDRTAFLQGLDIGDIIDGAGQRWAIQNKTDQGTYMSFGVNPALVGAPIGIQAINFETVTPTPITTAYDTDYWLGETAQGLLGVDTDYADIVPDDNAYGTDLLVQHAIVSAHWDMMAYSASGESDSNSNEVGILSNSIFTIDSNYTVPPVSGSRIIVCVNTTDIVVTLPVIGNGAHIAVIRAGTGEVTINGNGVSVQGQPTQRMPLPGDAADLINTPVGWLLK